MVGLDDVVHGQRRVDVLEDGPRGIAGVAACVAVGDHVHDLRFAGDGRGVADVGEGQLSGSVPRYAGQTDAHGESGAVVVAFGDVAGDGVGRSEDHPVGRGRAGGRGWRGKNDVGASLDLGARPKSAANLRIVDCRRILTRSASIGHHPDPGDVADQIEIARVSETHRQGWRCAHGVVVVVTGVHDNAEGRSPGAVGENSLAADDLGGSGDRVVGVRRRGRQQRHRREHRDHAAPRGQLPREVLYGSCRIHGRSPVL